MIPLKDDNPTRRTPIMTFALIGACASAFLWQQAAGLQASVYMFGLIPDVVLGDARLPPELAQVPPWMTVFTSMFMHGGWLHLAGNLLYLWIFADNVEDELGRVRFIFFYLLCGVAAAAAQALPDAGSQIPMVGASGAISGVLGAYLIRHPRAHVLVLIPLGFFTQLTRMPAMFVLGLWFAMQLLSELTAPDGAGVAFRAHIGGFVAGLVLLPVFGLGPRWRRR